MAATHTHSRSFARTTTARVLAVAGMMLSAGACSRDAAPPAVPATSTAPAAPAAAIPARPAGDLIQPDDAFYLRTAGDPQISPDGTRVLFTVQFSDRIGTPYTRIWIADVAAGTAAPWGAGDGQEGATELDAVHQPLVGHSGQPARAGTANHRQQHGLRLVLTGVSQQDGGGTVSARRRGERPVAGLPGRRLGSASARDLHG